MTVLPATTCPGPYSYIFTNTSNGMQIVPGTTSFAPGTTTAVAVTVTYTDPSSGVESESLPCPFSLVVTQAQSAPCTLALAANNYTTCNQVYSSTDPSSCGWNPTLGALEADDQFQLSGTCTNNTSDAITYTFTATISGTTYTVTVAPYSFVVETTTLNNGGHTFSATAADMNSNTNTVQVSVTVTNTVATNPPSISITSPSNGTKVSGTISVAASASDPGTSVSTVQFYLDGKLMSTDSSSPYACSMNTKKWWSGTHSLVCKATNPAGQVGTSATVSVTK